MFAYCGNNPVRYVDFHGQDFEEAMYDENPKDDLMPDPGAPPSTGPVQNGIMSNGGNTGRSYNFNGPHGENYMHSRGWTYETIDQAVSNGRIGGATNKANGNPATVYGHPVLATHYVVIDDVTRNIVQLSNLIHPVWYPDSTITFD